LQGMSAMKRGLVLDLNPFVVGPRDRRAAGPRWQYSNEVEPGANVRWGVTPNLTAQRHGEPRLLPGGVGREPGRHRSRQASFFPEKRPFFLDGIEQFTTPNNLIYTRRIVAPVASAKLAGKAAGPTSRCCWPRTTRRCRRTASTRRSSRWPVPARSRQDLARGTHLYRSHRERGEQPGDRR
jgi:hypothetical protein